MSRILLPSLLGLLLLNACGGSDEIATIHFEDPLEDPQVVVLDARAPSTQFDGRFGSILTSTGWAPPEIGDPRGDPYHFAWVVDGAGTLWFPPVEDEPLDFWALCRPFTWPEAPPQVLSLFYEDRELGRLPMDIDWQEIRFPLPAEIPRGTPFELTLRFDRTNRPSEVLPDNTDNRRLSASCQTLAIIPRDLEEVPAFLDIASLTTDDDGQELELPAGGSAEWPLPPHSAYRLRLGNVSSRCSSCTLHIRGRSGAGAEELWSGPPSEATGLELAGENADSRVARLRFDWSTGESPSASANSSERLTVGLPKGFLAFEPVEPVGSASTAAANAAEAPPHLFLYLVDTLRADLAQDPELAPNIARFAQEAVTYEKVWSASAWTLPSVVSILTGVYPHRHGVHQGHVKLSPDLGLPPLSTRLAGAGYDSLALSQSLVASARFGVDTGFHRFFYSNQLNSWSLRTQELRRSLLRHLFHRRTPEAPLFAYLHSVGPHAPYAPLGSDRRFAEEHPGKHKYTSYIPHQFMSEGLGEDPAEVRHLEALYRGEVAYADREFGHFLDLLRYLDLYDNSLIVLVSDHGEEFGEHKGFDHGRTLYEELIRVPLFIKYPGGRFAGERVETRVSTVDLAPTLLAEAGIDPSILPLDGTPLHPDTFADRPRSRRLTFSEVHPARSAHAEAVSYRALVLDDIKCLESLSGQNQFGEPVPPLRVYDLAADPLEQNPITDDKALERCRRLLDQWIEQLESLPTADSDQETSPETLEKLRALGYID